MTDGAPRRLQNWIGGERKDPHEGRWLARENPVSGDAATEVPDSGLLDLVRAIQAAHKPMADWQKSELPKRAEVLAAFANELEKDLEKAATLQASEDGSPLAQTREDVKRAISVLRYYARTLAGPELDHGFALGVVGVITPWSDPFFALASRVGAALAGGNVVIAKPSEFAAQSADFFAELLARTSLPVGVFNLVHGRGETVGQTIAQHPGISSIAFVGSTEVGRSLHQIASEGLKRVHLAMGARNPVLIFAGHELDQLIPEVVRLCTTGPVCLRGSRVFVQETIYKEFREKLKAQLAGLKLGNPLDPSVQLGPLSHRNLIAKFQKAATQATGEDGRELGAETSVPAAGNFVRPTAIFDLTLCSTLQQEEVVGPFITVSSFKYQHEAVKNANNCPFAQAAYVYEVDAAKAARVGVKLEASRVFVNPAKDRPYDPSLVFEGMKNSGLGRDGGVELIKFFQRTPVQI